MDRSIVLAPGSYAIDLGWQAQSATIQCGANWVTIDDQTFPPQTTNAVVNLIPSTNIGAVLVTAPPAGQTPLGPIAQTQTVVRWDSTLLPASGGSFTPAAPVVSVQLTQAPATVATINIGLARALTMVITGIGGAAGTIVVDDQMPDGSFLRVVSIAGITSLEYSAGQGTTYEDAPNTTLRTRHLPPVIHASSSAATGYMIDLRLYF